MHATAFWAALLAPVYLWLSLRVIGLRRRLRVAIGAGGQPALERGMRAQANFAEYVPFALVLLALAEAGGTPWWVLHPLGAALLAGRIAHGWGITRESEDFRFRVGGMMATFGVIACAALAALGTALI
ncbi:MAPEG family protein [Roseomonas rosulenta]|uniref:MAPEG family protein n=1 Tax=Roseomonas rosulenta TaxID=2748667 RepID=UPI0018DF9E6E|nr:MAPEG family protein [Roseomonas rosulenta]